MLDARSSQIIYDSNVLEPSKRYRSPLTPHSASPPRQPCVICRLTTRVRYRRAGSSSMTKRESRIAYTPCGSSSRARRCVLARWLRAKQFRDHGQGRQIEERSSVALTRGSLYADTTVTSGSIPRRTRRGPSGLTRSTIRSTRRTSAVRTAALLRRQDRRRPIPATAQATTSRRCPHTLLPDRRRHLR